MNHFIAKWSQRVRELAELLRKVGAELTEPSEMRIDVALLCRRDQLRRTAVAPLPDHRTSFTPGIIFHVELVIDALHVLEGRESIDIVDQRLDAAIPRNSATSSPLRAGPSSWT